MFDVVCRFLCFEVNVRVSVCAGQASSELVVLRDREREGVGWYCWAGGLQAPAHFRTVRTPLPQSPAVPIKSRAPLYKDCQLCPAEPPFCLSSSLPLSHFSIFLSAVAFLVKSPMWKT